MFFSMMAISKLTLKIMMFSIITLILTTLATLRHTEQNDTGYKPLGRMTLSRHIPGSQIIFC